MEHEILKLIVEHGPLTGSELWETLGCDPLPLWQACRCSEKLAFTAVGTRYLRLDRRVEGYARLSPSILREFLTYTVVGEADHADALSRRAGELRTHTEDISRTKLDTAYRIASGLEACSEILQDTEREVCFIIAGDIVYNMAHDVPRPERSTGKPVNGSDMDMVVVVDDQMPKEVMERLDNEIYREKIRILMAPGIREEIDYVVKPVKKIREQLRFERFRHMVACKILREGTFLFGTERLFRRVKDMLRESGVSDRLTALESRARDFRADAEAYLLKVDSERFGEKDHQLFYPSEESEEFE
ncbi:MAG: hypothetical protein JRF65_06575 [Deltaproteobacteria bacterium]|nr:hypothetical protein [Deltaproteobacteria bacterium]